MEDNSLESADTFSSPDLEKALELGSGRFPDVNAVKMGDQVFTVYPMSRGRETLALSNGQFIFLQTLLETNNPNIACAKAGVNLETALRWLSGERIKRYFGERKLEVAHARGLTVQFLDSLIFKALMDGKELNRNQTKVLEIAYKRLGLLDGKGSNPFSEADEYLFVAKKGPKAIDVTSERKESNPAES